MRRVKPVYKTRKTQTCKVIARLLHYNLIWYESPADPTSARMLAQILQLTRKPSCRYGRRATTYTVPVSVVRTDL